MNNFSPKLYSNSKIVIEENYLVYFCTLQIFRLTFPNELNLARFVEEQTCEENASAEVRWGEFVSIK